jgi:hypothetical protein
MEKGELKLLRIIIFPVLPVISSLKMETPENIPSAEHIKKVEKRLSKTKPKLLLDDKGLF